MQKFFKNSFGVTRRKCKKSDYTFVYNLMKTLLFPFIEKYQKINSDWFDQNFQKRYKEMFILQKGTRRIGLYELTPNKNTLTITRIFLTPFYQSKGIGKFLMEYFETLGYKKIELQVWDNNPAKNFYKKLGYKIKNKKDHKLFMEKTISP